MGKKSKSRRGSASSRSKATPPRPSRSPPAQRGPLPKRSSPSSPDNPPPPSWPTRRGPPTPSPRPRRRSPTIPSSPPTRSTPPNPSSSPRRGTPAPSPASSPRRGSPAPSPASSPRRGTPAPSPAASPRRSTPAPSPASSPRRSTPAPSPASSPGRGTPTPSPSPTSSSPRRGHARAPPSSPSASTREASRTPIFDFCLDNAEDTLAKAFQRARDHFSANLDKESLVEGKLVTYNGGCFILRILPSANSTENAVYALYRIHNLYLDSILSRRIWYRFKDHQAPLPPELESDGVVLLDWKSKYGELGCEPGSNEEKGMIIFGESTCRARHETLLDLEQKRIKSVDEVKKALVLLILFAEGLRFPELERWLLATLATKRELSIPKHITMLFRKWETLSKILHKGRHEFKKFEDQKLRDRFKTYDDVCNVLGVVNQVNQRKEANEQAKRKKREGAEANSDSERRRRKKKNRH